MVTRKEHDVRQRFAARYGEARTDVIQQIERAVIGGDWGANGYTTMQQADQLATALRLGPERGCWTSAPDGAGRACTSPPARAARSCSATSPAKAYGWQWPRRHRKVIGPAVAVVASARALPFRPAMFDAVVHADVLC